MRDEPKLYYRRNLPHWQPEGAAIFLTFQLNGSLPRVVRERMAATRTLLERESAMAGENLDQRRARHNKKLFAMLDQVLDKAQDGPLWLKEERIAALVESALLDRYRDLYTLWAYVVMANHIHTLLQPKLAKTSINDLLPRQVPLKDITQRLKGYTALEANRLLHRTGQNFWQQESFDHWARDEEEFYRIVGYIENNPVKAGLVSRPKDWLCSSAHERLKRGWEDIRPLT